jgi:hypothetical protein
MLSRRGKSVFLVWNRTTIPRKSNSSSVKCTNFTVPAGNKQELLCCIYRVFKKSLCTWCLQYGKLQIMFLAQYDCLAADRQGQGDTRLILTPSVIPNSNYVIVVSDWNCLKHFCVFLYCNRQAHRFYIYLNYKRKLCMVGWTCSTHGWGEPYIQMFSGKCEIRRTFGRYRHRWEGNIKLSAKEITCEIIGRNVFTTRLAKLFVRGCWCSCIRLSDCRKHGRDTWVV